MKYFLYTVLVMISIFSPSTLMAQELVQDEVEVLRAEVIEVVDQSERIIPISEVAEKVQTIRVRILEGEQKGSEITFENDYVQLRPGEKFFLFHSTDVFDGTERYAVRDVDRRAVIFFFLAIFVAVVLIFSGKQGLRSLLGLTGSFFVILYILIPSLVKGYPPVIMSVAVAATILFLAIYLTHGFNRVSTVAFLGTVLAVMLTGILAYLAVSLARFSGFVTEEAFYLNINTRGALDFTGLLLGGIMIGVLGVLDDIAITQVAVVRELYNSTSHLSRKEIYKKALRVGREHVGALVNTLALAYTGASLPLMLLFSFSDTSISNIINQEIFATEIIRTVVGSIGLILTVPIATLLAVFMLKGYTGAMPDTVHIH